MTESFTFTNGFLMRSAKFKHADAQPAPVAQWAMREGPPEVWPPP
jgi:hypothetical protein